MIELGVVQSVEQMNRARAGSGQADTDFASKLCVRAGHEGGHLFMSHLNEIDLAFGAVECAHDSVDAVAGISVDAPHAPLGKAVNQEIRSCLRHGTFQSR